MQHHQDLIRLRPHALLVEQFGDWLRYDGDDLIRSADLLGGDLWARRAQHAVDLATRGGDPVRLVEAIGQLHRLLSLDLTDDPFSAEALRFAAIHPDHPDADMARLCCEALERALPSLRVLASHGVTEAA
jgi:hypothetical protein